MKNLSTWLHAKKILLNIIVLKARMKKVGFDLKLKLNEKRIYPTKSVKYLGINNFS